MDDARRVGDPRLRWLDPTIGWLSVVALIYAMIPSPAFGQVHQTAAIEGEVLAEATGLPIEGVRVSDGLTGVAVETDVAGYFRLPLTGGGPGANVEVVVEALGYGEQRVRVPTDSGDLLVFRLQIDPVELAAIEAQVEKEPLPPMTPASEVISRDVLEDFGNRAPALIDVLQAKGPPRLQMRTSFNGAGLRFCIGSNRRSLSAGTAEFIHATCRPAVLMLDGQILYTPGVDAVDPSGMGEIREEVTRFLLEMDPGTLERVRYLSPIEARFQFGPVGRFGALIVETRRGSSD